MAKLLLPRKVTERFVLLTGDDWQERLAEELGPRVAGRVGPYLGPAPPPPDRPERAGSV